MAFNYPVCLELRGRRCTVLGRGPMVDTRAQDLLDAGAEVRVICREPGPAVHQLAADGRLDLLRRPYTAGDLTGTFLALAVGCSPGEAARIHAEAKEAEVLLNVMDDAEHCDFSLPSVLRRGDLVLAISTGGQAPALAKRLRLELAERFGPEWGRLVELLGRVRQEVIGERQVDFDTWAARWAAALEHDLAGLVRTGRMAEAEDLVRRCLAEGAGTSAWPLERQAYAGMSGS